MARLQDRTDWTAKTRLGTLKQSTIFRKFRNLKLVQVTYKYFYYGDDNEDDSDDDDDKSNDDDK
jgi:hypothetical protein